MFNCLCAYLGCLIYSVSHHADRDLRRTSWLQFLTIHSAVRMLRLLHQISTRSSSRKGFRSKIFRKRESVMLGAPSSARREYFSVSLRTWGAKGRRMRRLPMPRFLSSAANRTIGSTTGCTITEKAPTRAFSWLKAATTAFTFKTLLRHYYAKRSLTPL